MTPQTTFKRSTSNKPKKKKYHTVQNFRTSSVNEEEDDKLLL